MIKKTDWVIVTIAGDPELAKDIKNFMGLVLDWAILNNEQFLKARESMKNYDQTTALKSTDRVQFYLVKKAERLKTEKAGFVRGNMPPLFLKGFEVLETHGSVMIAKKVTENAKGKCED